MKYLTLTFLITLWIVSTIILGISIIGIVVFTIEDESGGIYWFAYGQKLLDKFNN